MVGVWCHGEIRTVTRRAAALAALATATACGSGTTDPSGAAGTTADAPVATAAPGESQLVSLTVPARSLDGNLLGDPSELTVAVRTPASYDESAEVRYPVVYYLAGYDEPASIAPVGAALDELVAAGDAPDMILVGVSGDNAMGGSFYVDSPVSGRWASAIVGDLVPAIDARYRTLPSAASRGIAGFSMGGYGALSLAMAHPDVFGAVYALSPGLFAPGGLADTQMFDDPSVVDDVLAGQAQLGASVEGADVAGAVVRAMSASADARFAAAYGMAFAPDPEGPPPWMRYPYTEAGGEADPEVWALWEDGYGGIAPRVEAQLGALMSLRGIVLDVGTRDEYAWIPLGVEHLHQQLEAAGVPHRYETYDGGHGPIGPRADAVMLPFFAGALATS